MPLTNAEKQRRYREKLKSDPQKLEEIRKKNLLRIKLKTTKISQLNEEEKNKQREIWRNQKRKQKQNKMIVGIKDSKATVKNANAKIQKRNKLRFQKLQEENKKNLLKVKTLKSTVDTLRKRMYREKIRMDREIKKEKYETMLVQARCEMLESLLHSSYKKSSTLQKRIIKNIAVHEALAKKIPMSFVARNLGVKKIRIIKKRTAGVSDKIRDEMEKFFTRNDISRMTSGKKECRTFKKDKKQIRYLTDTLMNLYKIYKSDGGKYGFTTFFKYKPFYVLSPTMQSRDTCLCVKHSNVDFLLKALKSYQLIQQDTRTTDVLSNIVCDVQSYKCMYNNCQMCKNSHMEFNLNDEEKEKILKWYQWEREKYTYKKVENGESKEVTTKKYLKKMKEGTATELIDSFNEKISQFRTHYYNMKTQQKQYRQCIEKLKPHEVLLLCDFSENYTCKLREEIQALHYGASKQQVTLHCGIIYYMNKSESFCSVSDNLSHEPPGIWAHLLPVIRHMKQQNPNVTVIHYFSDGPSSQYRQKKNFYLFNLFSEKLHLCNSTWSFSESGHGKGVADGIGGTVKRALDRQMLYGHDICNATDAHMAIVAAVKSVTCYMIPSNDVDNMKKLLPNNIKSLKAVPNTMKIHQIMNKEPNVIKYRPLSCFCSEMCLCYIPKTHKLVIETTSLVEVEHCPNLKTDKDYYDLLINSTASNNVLDLEKTPFLKDCDVINISATEIDPEYSINIDINQLADLALPMELNKVNIQDLIVLSEDSTFTEHNFAAKDLGSGTSNLPLNQVFCPVAAKNIYETEFEPSTSRAIKKNNQKDTVLEKRVKVLKTIKTERNENKRHVRSLKTVITRSFLCHLCKIRKPFGKEMVQCMSCKNWVCLACSCTKFFDYICDNCLNQ